MDKEVVIRGRERERLSGRDREREVNERERAGREMGEWPYL